MVGVCGCQCPSSQAGSASPAFVQTRLIPPLFGGAKPSHALRFGPGPRDTGCRDDGRAWAPGWGASEGADDRQCLVPPVPTPHQPSRVVAFPAPQVAGVNYKVLVRMPTQTWCQQSARCVAVALWQLPPRAALRRACTGAPASADSNHCVDVFFPCRPRSTTPTSSLLRSSRLCMCPPLGIHATSGTRRCPRAQPFMLSSVSLSTTSSESDCAVEVCC